jgi:thiamine-phosphate pyrophosphorylase
MSRDSARTAAVRAAIRLYAITPHTLDLPREYAVACNAALAGGATAIQYRDKRDDGAETRWVRAAAVVAACRRAGAVCIINDDVELCMAVEADGVHLGPGDMSPAEARRVLGATYIIGASAGTPERALHLVNSGVDYIGVGAIFDATTTKEDASPPRGPQAIASIREVVGDLPLVAIGGITTATVATCIAHGADGVAVVREIFGAADVEASARALKSALAGPKIDI